MEAQQQGRGEWGNKGSQKWRGGKFFKTSSAEEVPLEDSIWQDQLTLDIDCFHSSSKLQQAQLPKTIKNFDTTAKLLEKTFISTHLPLVSQ